MGWDVLDAMTRAAEMGVEHGLERWAIVADGLKQLAAKNRVDVDGLAVLTTEDRDEAFEWVRE